jgi:hypothetical protein
MMALPHVPHEPFETGRVALDPDGQMDWVLPFDFVPENCTSSIANCQNTEGSGFGLFDQSNFEFADPFGTFPSASQISNSQHHTVDPKLLSQQNWISSETDSTSSSFGSHTSARENNSSTSSAGTHSTNSSLSLHKQQVSSFNTLHPNKRRYCELPMDGPVPLLNQAPVVYPVSTQNEAPEQKAIAIFECWLSTCPSVYPENSEFDNLAALTKLDAVVVKSWFAKQLRVRHMDDSMFETWLCSYPSAYPGDEEFRNLASLTRLSLDTVREWFAQKLRFKGSGIHHNNASPAVSNSGILIDPPLHCNTSTVNITQQSSLLQRAASWVRQERDPKCKASPDQSLLLRDDNKPYQCTRKCGKKFRDRDDWRKHEERNWPQEGWVCDLSATATVAGIQICTHCGVPNPTMDHFQTHKKSICNNKAFAARGRLHHRKQHFLQHFDNVHPHVPGEDFVRNSHFWVDGNFPRRCGFCQHRFIHWKNRVEHIGAHFHDHAKDMTEWRDHLETEDHSTDEGEGRRKDDNDDSNDDASDSSDDDSDGAPPPSRPKRRNCTKSSRPPGRPKTTALEPNNINQQRGNLMFDKSFGNRFTNPSGERKNFKRHLLQDSGFRSRGEAAKRVEEWTSFQVSSHQWP